MEWHEYVHRVVGDDKQIDVARKTGLDQATISRWLNPATSSSRRTSQSVRMFALGYGRDVLEAFVVAGFLLPEEAGLKGEPLLDLATVSSQELVREMERRMMG